jgi:formate/nitrite transporter FocA (FNT family)
MEQLKIYLRTFISAIIAGIMISIGGTVYLSTDNHVIGSLLFGIGLFVILVFQFNLFTGKVGYLLYNKPNYMISLVIIWFGNLFGTDLYCQGLYYIRPDLALKATTLCNAKLIQPIYSTLILAFFCGLLMYIAVDNFKNNKSDIGKYIGVFLCVSVFILCKFEHCIADMFYFGMMNGLSLISLKALKFIVVVTIGNCFGSWLVPIYNKLKFKGDNN